MTSPRTLLLGTALLLPLMLTVGSAANDQWTCKMIWIFKMPCVKPMTAMLRQVQAWSDVCDRQDDEERCLYELVEATPEHMEVIHLSERNNKTTTMHFDFSPPRAPSFCKMKVSSSSDVNMTDPNEYCLIYNLVEASRLIRAPGSRMICNEGMCPSLKSAPCAQ